MLEIQYEIIYRCYKCHHSWVEVYSCACDSDCGECGAKNNIPIAYKEIMTGGDNTSEDGNK